MTLPLGREAHIARQEAKLEVVMCAPLLQLPVIQGFSHRHKDLVQACTEQNTSSMFHAMIPQA